MAGYRSFLISTWQSSKLDSGRKAHFRSKLRRFFDYCLGRPEFNLEVVPSWDQDNLVAKNKGRQRASESCSNFHIGRPHIQCIFSWLNDFTESSHFFETFSLTRSGSESLIESNQERKRIESHSFCHVIQNSSFWGRQSEKNQLLDSVHLKFYGERLGLYKNRKWLEEK